jgi:hypothetical protein
MIRSRRASLLLGDERRRAVQDVATMRSRAGRVCAVQHDMAVSCHV